MSTATATTGLKEGRVVAIAGPVIDVEFPRGALPELNQALEFTVMVEASQTTFWPKLHSSLATAECVQCA